MQRDTKKPQYDVARMLDDMADLGLQPAEVARRAGLHKSTVSRFLDGDFRTAPTAKRIAEALGHSVRRYVIRRAVAA